MSNRDEFLNNIIVVDTETTSINAKEAEVIELGMVYRKDGEWVGHGKLYKPAATDISPMISSVTHITDDMVKDCDYFGKSVEEDFNKVLDSYSSDLMLTAHNSPYDSTVLSNYDIRDLANPWLCTFRMVKKLFAEDTNMENNKLVYLRYYFDLKLSDNFQDHRAESDAYVTAMLLERCIDEMEEKGIVDKDLPYAKQINEWLAEPVIVTHMPFGKHKGAPLTEVPMSYWTWALSNMDLFDENSDRYDPDFAKSVELAIEKVLDL